MFLICKLCCPIPTLCGLLVYECHVCDSACHTTRQCNFTSMFIGLHCMRGYMGSMISCFGGSIHGNQLQQCGLMPLQSVLVLLVLTGVHPNRAFKLADPSPKC